MLKLLHEGKIRKMYELDEDRLVMYTGNGISAFDVVFDDSIPFKGTMLVKITEFWMNMMKDLIPNHLSPPVNFPAPDQPGAYTVIKRLEPLKVEAIVRGYLIGSGWKDYQATGGVCGIELPKGLELASKLPEPIYTPSSKAPKGQHDENITFEDTVDILGLTLANQVKDVSLAIFKRAGEYLEGTGVIIADTKFEFGVDANGVLHLIDEVLTPDSSRFWDASNYKVGISPPSYDKQIVRDYLEELDWDKTAPGPEIPDEIKERVSAKYAEIMKKIIYC